MRRSEGNAKGRMRFAIDVAFVAEDGPVIKSAATCRSNESQQPGAPLRVLELPVGALERGGVHSGDLLRIEQM
jgi:uncharacterized membrane protein (UPF0127 family)